MSIASANREGRGEDSSPGAAAGADSSKNDAVPETAAAAAVDCALGLTAGDRRFLWTMGLVILVLSGVHWARLSGWGLHEVEIERLPQRRLDFRVDINRGTWVEWMQLEGIGELTARKIVRDREERGPFPSIDDLDRVPGIGPKTLATIRPWLECRDCLSP